MDAKETTCYMNTVQLSKELNIKNKICADPRSSYPDQNRIKTEPSTGEWNESALPMSSTMVKDDTDASTLHTEFDVKNEVDTSTYAEPISVSEIQRKDQQVVADKESDGDTFVCYHCKYATRSKRYLIDHMIVHKGSKNVYSCYSSESRQFRRKVHECTKCIYKSVSAKYLKRHMSTHSDRVGNRITNRCIYCNKTFVFKRTLDDHIVRKHPDFIATVSKEVHECPKCTYKTVSTNYLKRHMGFHRDSADNHITNKCIYCTKTLSSKQALDDHVIKTHPDFIASVSSKVHECTRCTYKTTSNSHLKRHMMVKHPDIVDYRITNRCVYCNKTFTNKPSLDDHVLKTHPDFIASVSSKVHECTECTYKTTSNGNFKRHMIVKHANVADIHITNRCIYCNKTFTSKQALDGHIIKTHPDFIASVSSKVHGCTECTYRTTSNSNLKRHMDTHPDIAGNHVFRCIYCKNTLTCKKVLDDHIVKKHPDFIASISSKVHECTKCSFKTVHPSRLKKHIKVKHPDIDGNHITNRCIYCNKTFTSKQALDGHIIKTHPDFIASVTSKVHECTECTYKTTSNECIRQHIMAKHPETADNHIFSRCMYCNNTFTCRRVLDDPIVKRHPDFIASVSRKVHKCTKCTFKTVRISHLKDHIMVKHPDIGGDRITNRCIYCSKTFTSTQSLDDHIIKTHPDFIASVSRKVHECTECTYKSTSNGNLKRHMVKHLNAAGNHTTARCIYCNITFVQKQTLDDHIVKTHPDFIASVNTKIHECTQGTYKTTIPKDIREHLMSKHTEIADNHIFNRCIYCNNTFTSKPSLDDHIVKRHPDFIASVSRKIHECTNCTFKTVRLSRLKEHIKVKHPDTASDRIINNCIYCNKTFVHKRTLNDHIVKTHPDFAASVNRKIFECTECTYKTVSTNDLKRHMMVKHPDIAGGRITVRCSYCNKTFISKSSLDDHILKTHPDFIASVSRKVHECTECTYKTVFTSQLRRHMVKHPDIAGNYTTIRCSYCNKTFESKRSLDNHIVKRHPDFVASVSSKIHGCTQCTYRTTISRCLKEHLMVKHSEIGNRKFRRCIYCNKTFVRRETLDDHIIKMVKHSDIAGDHKTNRCTHCNEKFTSSQALDDHIVKRRPDFIAPFSMKIYECSNSNSHLKRHMVKHSDIAGDHITNRCTHCNKTFTSTQALDDHIVKRHPYFIASVSRKVHECTECTYKTVLSSQLRRHMAKHPDKADDRIINRCSCCNKTFVREETLDDHIVEIRPDFMAYVSRKVHECTQCTYKTTNISHLKQRMAKYADIVGNHTTNKYIHCNKIFTTKQRLDDHVIKAHPDLIASVSSKVHEYTECT
nr:unnamed protein product [Callosobruchus analis]